MSAVSNRAASNQIGSQLPSPEACADILAVRAGVDEIDRRLIELIAIRQRFMEAAARMKKRRDQVYDAARIEDVVAKVRSAAHQAGLSTAIAEPVWRTLIDRCIAFELERWDEFREAKENRSP